ncbi:chymotrypsin-2 [Drosophila tropicalis]|uniref:chymotrypsin-2 n=1 Tax=Drosophila tropicalis TaxID=46794 RepID=UPI0035AC200D
MRTLCRSTILLTIGLVFLIPTDALRMRGDEQLPGLAALNKRRPTEDEMTAKKGPQGRVVGGTTAALGEWPWIVTLQNIYSFHFCSGVIISENWVITAASCVSGLRPRNVLVVVGTVDWWDYTAVYYNADAIHVHCNFDNPLYHNDIALIHIYGEFEFDDYIANATLADIDELQEGDKLKFAGWGSSSSTGTYERYLQQAEGTYLPVEQCRADLGDTEDVDYGHVCVKLNAGTGACHGDAGGPLIDEQNRVVGFGNWGVPCGYGRPDVYARAAFYSDWIRTTINGCGSA